MQREPMGSGLIVKIEGIFGISRKVQRKTATGLSAGKANASPEQARIEFN